MKNDMSIVVRGDPVATISIHPDDLAPMVKALHVCSKNHYDSKVRGLSDEANSCEGRLNGIITILDHSITFARQVGENVVDRQIRFSDIDILMKAVEMRHHLLSARLLSNDDYEALSDFIWMARETLRLLNEYGGQKNSISLHAPIIKDQDATT